MANRMLIDRPIDSLDQDTLQLTAYADAMASFLETCDTPVTVGIQGDWGIGKTSFLNLLRERMKGRQGRRCKTPVIYFNTWQYAQFNTEEYLGVAVLNGVITAIEKAFPEVTGQQTKQLKQYGSAALNFLAKAGSQLVKSKTGIDVAAAAASHGGDGESYPMAEIVTLLENYRVDFERLVGETVVPGDQDRLVIMIDDLDRVRPVRAIELLEAIKNFLDVPKCVFLLAVDYSVIQQGVAEKLGTDTQKVHGKSFFDKIIQVPFNMPTSAYRFDRYVMSLLGIDYDPNSHECRRIDQDEGDRGYLAVGKGGLGEEDVKYFTNVTALTVGTNPRSVKRVVNYVKLLKLVCESSRKGSGQRWKLEDAKHLYALACIQLEWPELFSYFAEHPTPVTIKQFEDWDYIDSLPQMRPLYERSHNIQQLKSNISGFFDEVVGLLDVDRDGDIDAGEFRPVWQMMRDANLTSAGLEDADRQWKLVTEITRENDPQGVADSLVACLKASEWNDSLKLRILPAGKRFCNLVWDGIQIGSLATGKAEPVQFYLKLDDGSWQSESGLDGRIEHVGSGHYGIGQYKLNLAGILDDHEKAVSVLNQILTMVMSQKADLKKETD